MTEAQHVHFKSHCFPAEIIAHAVWLYYRFPLSFRDAEDLLAERGMVVFVPDCVGMGGEVQPQLRQRSRGQFSDRWYLYEMVVSIRGKEIRALAGPRCQWLRSRRPPANRSF